MHNPFRWSGHNPSGTTSLIIGVLIASMVVATALAAEAIAAARDRRAVSEAMLRQYAQLAAWEFSRQAQRDVDQSLLHTLTNQVHPQRGHQGAGNCNCEPIALVEQWFEITAAGVIKTESDALRASLGDAIAHGVLAEGEGMEGQLRTAALKGDPTRFIAMKPEPHLAEGGRIGLVSGVQSLQPVLAKSYSRASLLPAVVVGDTRDPRTLVHLRISDGRGATVFESHGTVPGPYVVETTLLPALDIPLVAHAAMTPAFIASLGPAHGAAPRTPLVVALVAVNGLLVVVGLWQLRRERQVARLRSNFVAGVSHELRTPLAQIRMFSETLLLNRVRNDEEKKRALEIIGQESKRLSQLVDNVLLFHGRPREHAVGQGDVIDLKAFALEVVESFQPLAAAKGATLTFAFTPDAARVRGEESALRQVLLNLLDNAVKFGPAGQTITVRVTTDAAAVVLTVDDGGAGVSTADRERIFKAFERGHHTRGTGGAGIGLAVVKQIVVAHRGEVTVENPPEGGARFRVVLPKAHDAADTR